jgi:hypothetical protein
MKEDYLPRKDHAKIHTEVIVWIQKLERRVKELESSMKELQGAKKKGG